MLICIVSPGMKHDGNTLKERSLGGSETAAIQLAEALARTPDPFGNKNRVTVLSNCDAYCIVNGVAYIPLQATPEYLAGTDIDLLIVSRWQEPLMHPHNAKVCFYWCHDLALKRSEMAVRGIMYQIDRLLVMSQFQKKQYMDTYSVPDSGIEVIRNGIDLDLFPAPTQKFREKGQMVYCARPERGLENLVKPGGIMEILHRVNSPVTLHVAHYDNTTEQMKPYYDMLWARCNELPNVKLVGNLTKAQLYDLYRRSWLYLYPTDFEEISCISAMEARACGLPFMTTPTAALVETVPIGCGIFIDGPANTEKSQAEFVNQINFLYNKDDHWKKMSDEAYRSAIDLKWEPVAERLIILADQIMAENTNDPARMYRHFFVNSDIETCRAMTEKGGFDLSLVNDDVEYVKENFAFTSSPEAYREQYIKVDQGASVAHYLPSENEPRLKVLIDFLKTNKGKFKRILDYGCWIGHQAIRVANEVGPDVQVVGVDITKKNIELAEECKKLYSKHGNVNFEVWDEMEDHDKRILDREQYDLVICNEVLEHVLDPVSLIVTLENLCKQGGMIFLTTPSGPWEYESYYTFKYRCHLRHYEMADLLDIFGDKKDIQIFSKMMTKGVSERPMGHHYVAYVNDSSCPTGKVNHIRKYRWQRPRQTLSVCMIAYNAEDMLHRCLKSVKDIASEIIIAVDPKTTDSTRKIAETHGARVIEGIDPIITGFDEARNLSIKEAKGDWIMWIDSDEELQNPRKIEKYLRANVMDGYAVQQHHMSVDPPMVLKPDLPMRLFRKGKGIKFFGVCHEHPEKELNKGVGYTVVLSDSVIAHDGYLTEAVRRRRFLRNIDLVMADRKKYKDRNLGKFLWLRDLIHLIRYRKEQMNGQGMDKDMHDWAVEAKMMFEKEFMNDISNPMIPEALSYYSEANNLLDIGVPIKISYEMPGVARQDIEARFPNSDIAADFAKNLIKAAVSNFEGKYL